MTYNVVFRSINMNLSRRRRVKYKAKIFPYYKADFTPALRCIKGNYFTISTHPYFPRCRHCFHEVLVKLLFTAGN